MKGWVLGVAAAAALFATAAQGAEVNIVALGASNTYGSGRGRTNGGVPSSQAYPAQLQRLLAAKGVSAHVANAGIPGDTTGGMLARLNSAVPNGTMIVILQPGGNDARRGEGASRQGNIAEIKHRLAARHIKVIMLGHLGQIAPKNTRDPDGQHFNAQGHAAFAAWLAPQVMAAARGK
ncbi:GDSL-type esterase/lipase family protein [Afipia sp. 1NLS2]|uniref:GDSL-type esterase/lipase family protein n=1 Tax=Afipia sp. 1NLS2 TaxID=666684 RepID=UPI0001DA04F1|nr:GDSL-type esterase/lipase family protein [Afipia sp. 1NLS2]EFI50496.1 lipolytic protein G-D-S-L family [Afipia sp. 1NLS2]